MAFTVSDFQDLVRLLNEHPDWRKELRRAMALDEMHELQRLVRELVEAQTRAEKRLEGVEDRLARAEKRLEGVEDRLARAEKRLEGVEDRLARAEKRLEGVEDRLARLEEAVQELVEVQTKLVTRQDQLIDDVAELKGWALESRYRDRPYAYFGRWLRKLEVINPFDLPAVEAARGTDQLSVYEWEQLSALDLLLRGQRGTGDDARDVYMALEVSYVIDLSDVERARRRAELLRRLGYRAVAAAGGIRIQKEAQEYAEDEGVVIALDGQVEFWPEAEEK